MSFVMPSNRSKMLNVIVIAVVGIASLTVAAPAFAAPAAPTVPVLKAVDLRTEYRLNPLGIAEERPRLSWLLHSADETARGQRQTAYQILVASTRKKLAADEGDLWDTGKQKSDETIHIEYAGRPLKPGQRAFWKVKTWNAADEASPWSESAMWSAGLLSESDWKAKWIGYDAPEPSPATAPAATQETDLVTLDNLKWVWTDEGDATTKVPGGTRYFAKTITLPAPADGKIRKATFLLTADDNFQLFVNGKKVGAGNGHTRAHEIDVTPHLKPDAENVLGVAATNGGDNPAALAGRFIVWLAGPSSHPHLFDIDGSWAFSIDKPAGWDEGGAIDVSALKPVKEVVAVGAAPWGMPTRQILDLPPPPYLRKEFTADKRIARATLYATALGVYELHLNGRRISEDVLSPGWTDYNKRVYYRTYDVTRQLQRGANVVGAILGDGWYAGYFSYQGKREIYGKNPRLRVQLEIHFNDGSTKSIVTDKTWKASYGPEREGDLLMGSAYDARLEDKLAGWCTPGSGFDDSAWKAAAVDTSIKPEIKIEPHPGNPVTVHERLPANAIAEPTPGSYVFDLGQNMVGWTRLKLANQRPAKKIRLRHAEMLNPDGTLYLTALRGARAMDTYTTRGGEEESWEPKFTFHGFRYVEVSGLDAKPPLDAIEGVVVHTAMPRTGHFESGDKLVNQLHHNIIWGQKGNYLEVPTDCPQRDERLGWTGDAQFFIKTATYNFDVAAFFKKWLVDLNQDAQHPNGTFFDVAPNLLTGHGNVAWGDAAIICPHTIWRVYGDEKIIRDHYASMVRYMDYLEKNHKEYIRGVGAYGDWLNLDDKTKPEVIGTAYFSHVARLMSEMAEAIDKRADAKKYGELADTVRAAWIKNFLNADGSITDSGQTGYALAFTMDLLPSDRRAAAAEHFRKAIERKNNHLATGFIGTPRLLPALTSAGMTDHAYQLFLTKTFPSWLFQVTLGATTMWERWDGWTPDKGFQDPGMNSFNHYAFGSVGEWMFRTVGGIETDGPSFKKIILRPRPHDGDLTFANTKYQSIRGTIGCDWKRDGDTLRVKFIVPPNTTATAYVPANDPASVTESGKPTTDAQGVQFLWTEAGDVVYRLQSGTYEFVAR